MDVLLQVFGLDVAQRADTVVFMIIALLAAAILIVTFLLGEVFDVISPELGGVDDAGAGLLNVQTVAAFLAGFGSVGWLLSGYFDVPSLYAAAGGVAGGIPMMAAVVLMTRLFLKQEISTSHALADLTGVQGIVTLAIREAAPGRVSYSMAGGTHTAPARSASGAAIPQGTVVVVKRVVAGELHVAPEETD